MLLMYEKMRKINLAAAMEKENAYNFDHHSALDCTSMFKGCKLQLGSLSFSSVALYSLECIILVYFLIAMLRAMRSLYSKVVANWIKLLSLLDLREEKDYKFPNKTATSTASPFEILKKNSNLCADDVVDKFEEAFTRVLTTLQSANAHQIFLRRDDVAALVTKLIEVGACHSSSRLQRRLTFMDFDIEGIINRRTSLNDLTLVNRQSHFHRESSQSFLSEDVESVCTETDEDVLDIEKTLQTLMPREKNSLEKRLLSKNDDSIEGSHIYSRRGFVDALVSFSKPQFLTKTYTKLQSSSNLQEQS